MTYGEGRDKALMLLDEYEADGEADEDILAKLPALFDMAQKKVAQIKHIPALYVPERAPGQIAYPMPPDFMELRCIWRDGERATRRYRWRQGMLLLPESDRGLIQVEYAKIPATIPDDVGDEYTFEVAEDAAQCMPPLAAANILLSDLVQDATPLLQMYQLMVADLVTELPGDSGRLRQSFYRGM